uniref:Cilia- and flagella-associated protein 206 n=1 Tax=Trypanosoma congolense (strain IL3000) TaxID=1068625 RepID=G0UQP0_TRYCI|nr:conserved hypothetical protein [Trypanosoma congolense IL3000]
MDVTAIAAKEIVRRFRKLVAGKASVSLTVELASFALRLHLRSSSHCDPRGNVEMLPEAIEVVVDSVASFLATCSVDLMAALSLQCQTLGLHKKLSDRRQKDRVKHEAITLRLLSSLCDNSERSPEELLGEITFFILHCYKQLQESESGMLARKDTAMVLTAVLPRNQVPTFACQSSDEKKQQLEELRRIVWGIRLYNVACGRSVSNGILPPRENADSLFATQHTRIEEELREAICACSRYVSVLRSPSTLVDGEQRNLLIDEYYRQLQLLLNIRMVKQRLDTLRAHIYDELIPSYEAALAKVRGTLGTKSIRSDGVSLRKNVSKAVVYPLFIALSEAYEVVQSSFEGIEDINELMNLSLSLGKISNSSLPHTLLQQALAFEKNNDPVDHSAVATQFESVIAACPPDRLDCVQYTHSSEALHAHLASCAFNGMCPVTLLEEGICVEGCVNTTDPAFPGFVLRTAAGSDRTEWYAFMTASKLLRFAASSQRFVDHIAATMKSNVVLVGLLGLAGQFSGELYIKGTRTYDQQQGGTMGQRSRETATQTGQIDPYLDHNYRWNEWDLRRQALKLVNLLNMRTHSTQTIASHFRRDNSTQCRPPRDDSTQTMQDIAVQPARTVQYLKGLRGTKTSAIETVQKTFLY